MPIGKKRRFLTIILWTVISVAVILYLLPSRNVRDSNKAAALAAHVWWKTQFVDVETDVSVEVVDFGGTGRPILFLAGLGGSAHSFRSFAPKLAETYHVYAMTRRGFGNSSWPRSGYATARLGDDVAAVIDSLGLVRPVLIGHSFGGAELSSIARRHPDKVGGLIYLDAGYDYALHDTTSEESSINGTSIAKMLVPVLPRVFQWPALKVMLGQEKFTEIRSPVLAIFAFPHDIAFKDNPTDFKKAEEKDVQTGRQVDAFARQVSHARIVRIPNASHMIYRSNEAELLREIHLFADAIP